MSYNKLVLIIADLFKRPVYTIKIIKTRYVFIARFFSEYNYFYNVIKNCFIVSVYSIK